VTLSVAVSLKDATESWPRPVMGRASGAEGTPSATLSRMPRRRLQSRYETGAALDDSFSTAAREKDDELEKAEHESCARPASVSPRTHRSWSRRPDSRVDITIASRSGSRRESAVSSRAAPGACRRQYAEESSGPWASGTKLTAERIVQRDRADRPRHVARRRAVETDQ